MVWNIHMCVALEAVRGEQAQHALRITQESLANVMRHANASAVEVFCRVVPEAHEMVLEVRDNGRGIARGPDGKCTGKGLEGMRRRAQEAGGRLVISSRAGKGTRVKLTLALPEHEPAPGVTEEARNTEANTYIPSQTVWH
jgi:signal transduction histidine kinase